MLRMMMRTMGRIDLRVPATIPTIFRILTILAILVAASLVVPAGAPSALAAAPQDDAATGAGTGNGDGLRQSADPALASPAATLDTFLSAMNVEPPDYDRAIDCLDLSDVVRERGRTLAIRLFGVINRIEFVNVDRHPDRRDVERADLSSYTFFPRFPPPSGFETSHRRIAALAGPDAEIVLAPDSSGEWRFTAETVAGIEAFYESVRAEPLVSAAFVDERALSLTLRFEELLPDWMLQTAIGLKYWQWIGLAALILLGVIVDLITRFQLALVIRRIVRRRGGETNPETLRRTVRPFGLTAAGVFWLLTLHLLDLPDGALTVLLPAARLFATLAGVWSLFRVADLVSEVLAARASRTQNKFDDLLVPIVRKAAKIFVAIFGLIYVAESLDIEIAPLLTALGIGGVGFAFAAKDTLENFFGALTVIIDRPFEVGDWVVIGDVEGTVEELGLRSVRIRTFYNSLVSMPTANLVRTSVDNYGRRKYRRWKTHLNLTYDTPPEKIEAFCEGVRELIRVHPYTRKDYYQVWMHQFGAHSLDVLVYVFHEAPDWQTELRERHRLILDILRLAEQLGVEFAFPTQTLHVYPEERPDSPPEPPAVPERDPTEPAMAEGRRAVETMTKAADWRRSRPGPHRFAHPAPAKAAGDGDDDDETQIESKIGGDA